MSISSQRREKQLPIFFLWLAVMFVVLCGHFSWMGLLALACLAGFALCWVILRDDANKIVMADSLLFYTNLSAIYLLALFTLFLYTRSGFSLDYAEDDFRSFLTRLSEIYHERTVLWIAVPAVTLLLFFLRKKLTAAPLLAALSKYAFIASLGVLAIGALTGENPRVRTVYLAVTLCYVIADRISGTIIEKDLRAGRRWHFLLTLLFAGVLLISPEGRDFLAMDRFKAVPVLEKYGWVVFLVSLLAGAVLLVMCIVQQRSRLSLNVTARQYCCLDTFVFISLLCTAVTLFVTKNVYVPYGAVIFLIYLAVLCHRLLSVRLEDLHLPDADKLRFYVTPPLACLAACLFTAAAHYGEEIVVLAVLIYCGIAKIIAGHRAGQFTDAFIHTAGFPETRLKTAAAKDPDGMRILVGLVMTGGFLGAAAYCLTVRPSVPLTVGLICLFGLFLFTAHILLRNPLVYQVKIGILREALVVMALFLALCVWVPVRGRAEVLSVKKSEGTVQITVNAEEAADPVSFVITDMEEYLRGYFSRKGGEALTGSGDGVRFKTPEDCMVIVKVGTGQKSCWYREWFAPAQSTDEER